MFLRLAVYGKGGIGKSTISANLAYALSESGRSVLLMGCDPKHDTTRLLLDGRMQKTVSEYISELPPSRRRLDKITEIGAGGVACIESGGPEPGVGCAGRGILTAFNSLEIMGLKQSDYDFTVYDVLGDVVCGGFAVPLRASMSDAILIVTSGEFMSLYAANNIMRGMLNFETSKGRCAGIVLNRRGVKHEDSLVECFSRATGVPIVCRLDRSDLVAEADAEGQPVCHSHPESEMSAKIRELAAHMDDIMEGRIDCLSPNPLTDSELRSLYSTGGMEGRGTFRNVSGTSHGDTPGMDRFPRRRIGKGPAGAVREATMVTDMPVIIHGTRSCGFAMMSEIGPAVLASGDVDHISCTGMGEHEIVYGGAERLKEAIDSVANSGAKHVMVITSCISDMIGDDCRRVVEEAKLDHPGLGVMLVEAGCHSSGRDGHMDVLRGLCKLINTEVSRDCKMMNVVSDVYQTFYAGRNREYLQRTIAGFGMSLGGGFLGRCSLEDIIGFGSTGIAVLDRDDRAGRELRTMLEGRGIRFMDLPVPRGLRETIEWIIHIGCIIDEPEVADKMASTASSEYWSAAERHRRRIEGKIVAIITDEPEMSMWMADALRDCGALVTIHTILGDQSALSSARHRIEAECPDLLICDDGLAGDVGIHHMSPPKSYATHLASMELMGAVDRAMDSADGRGWMSWRDPIEY